jgi:hypothetical protein
VYEITKIDGQPMDEDLNKLIKELTNALGSVTIELGGGEHGHVGLIVKETEYITFSDGGVRYTIPANPKAYPANSNPDTAKRKQQVAEHKAKSWTRRKIVNAINHEWLAELESETMGFNTAHPENF